MAFYKNHPLVYLYLNRYAYLKTTADITER